MGLRERWRIGIVGHERDCRNQRHGWIGRSAGCPDDCDDGDVCTVDSCANGVCSHDVISIDDNDACTTDTCDAVSGITHTPVSADDGDVCTLDACGDPSRASRMIVSCDDADPCTADACSASDGCSHAPISVDDSDACTVDSCDASSAMSFIRRSRSTTTTRARPTLATPPATGSLSHTPVLVDDNDPCTLDVCDVSSGAIPHSPIAYFADDFHDNSHGWSLDTGWQIGVAVLGSEPESAGYGTDPATDHSSSADNGIAGVYIGGNVPKVITSAQYLTSPIIDLAPSRAASFSMVGAC